MKFIFKMESVLLVLTGVLCTLLIVKLIFSLRTILPWRVNCWFCNNNFWVKLPERNSWMCPKCEQYNGFTKDGDYNKPLFTTNEPTLQIPKAFQTSPPQNGLCKMCNINQQLKIAQLANFVPMNESNFDEEIEPYRMQLEKAYKLCSPCKKVLQMKLHKEKEVHLGNKLLETRTPDKTKQKKEIQTKRLQSFLNNTSLYMATVLLILVLIESYRNIMKDGNLSSKITNVKEIFTALLERIVSIIKMKTLLTFPAIENYLIDVHNVANIDKLPKYLYFTSDFLKKYNMMTQEAIGGFVCLIQIIGHIFNVNKLKLTVATDILWSIFVITCLAQHSHAANKTIMSLVKVLSMLVTIVIYRNMQAKPLKQSNASPSTPKRMKNLTKCTMNKSIDEDLSMETDDDVSLSQFGLHNFSESSNETFSPGNDTLLSGRAFTPRTNDTLWSKPKLNSTFCVNPVLKSPSSVSETIFVKPNFQKQKNESFKQYQKLTKDDSDSDLDESISSLCIGSPNKSKKNGSIFSLRKFTATPNFVAPTPLSRTRPLISPSKLGHSTSWVAGGYWDLEGDRQIFNVDGSRSSSQSSGFESQTSSVNQRNVFSQAPSREDSVCGEPDRSSVLMDRFQNGTMSNFTRYQGHQVRSFSRVSSPVYPQMQFNSHVHIPQPRFAQQSVPNVFSQQQFAQNSMFKTPGGSGLIKLPQTNSFVTR